jgi:SAM-dependent methyltransferase
VSGSFFRTLAEDTAARYKPAGRFAYHFALGKLTRDPAFAHILTRGLIPHGSRILDLGCGQGLLAALLETARARSGSWPARFSPPPDPVAYQGIDVHARDIERARHAVDGTARFVCGDIRREPFDAADAVILLDVLHYFDYGAQDDLLRRARAALRDGGMLMLRVGDESTALRFRYAVAIDQIVMTLRRHRVARLHCRPLAAWMRTLEALGFGVTATPMSAGTPFANVLLVARYDSKG